MRLISRAGGPCQSVPRTLRIITMRRNTMNAVNTKTLLVLLVLSLALLEVSIFPAPGRRVRRKAASNKAQPRPLPRRRPSSCRTPSTAAQIRCARRCWMPMRRREPIRSPSPRGLLLTALQHGADHHPWWDATCHWQKPDHQWPGRKPVDGFGQQPQPRVFDRQELHCELERNDHYRRECQRRRRHFQQ